MFYSVLRVFVFDGFSFETVLTRILLLNPWSLCEWLILRASLMLVLSTRLITKLVSRFISDFLSIPSPVPTCFALILLYLSILPYRHVQGQIKQKHD